MLFLIACTGVKGSVRSMKDVCMLIVRLSVICGVCVKAFFAGKVTRPLYLCTYTKVSAYPSKT